MKCIKWLSTALTLLLFFAACDKPDTPTVERVPEISVTPSKPEAISANGGEIKLMLMANLDWAVQDVPAWLTVSPESGTGSNYEQPVTVSAPKNIGGQREAVLKFVIEGASYDVKISQSHSFGTDAPSNTIFFESFKNSMGDFTIKDVLVPEQMSCVWEFSSQYECMKGTAFKNPSNYASESWLISPEIDLTSVSASYLTFEHAGGYFGTPSEEATVWISKDGGSWEQLLIDSKDYPTSWTFITAGNWDLTKYSGSKIKIGFKYYSTSTKAGTWEVRNVSVLSGTYEEIVIPNVDPKKTKWMELPAMDNSDYGYYSHRFVMNDQIYRNYSFAWSQKDLVSIWMAYPLNKTYTNKVVDRTDAWSYDPHLGEKLSSAPFSYYAGDYARGHQVPSADRLCCTEANEQTFYGTNIIPQLNEHNEGIWSNLEGRIRDVANSSDTTYVVTGCVVEGSKELTTDSDGKSMTVPVAYFKAVLRYVKSSTDATWLSAGFYTEHKDYGSSEEDLKAVSMSIDELEKKTGLDFFVNLVDKIGADKAAEVEAQDPTAYSVWKL